MNDPVITVISQYGWVAVAIYIVVRETLALLKKWLPENVKRTTAREAREAACEQREADALEQIAGALVTSSERLSLMERMQEELVKGLSQANQSLAVLLDRRLRSRKTDRKEAAAAD